MTSPRPFLSSGPAIILPAIIAYLIGAWCGVALTWDGSGYLFNTLQNGEPIISHHRYSNLPTLAAVVSASHFTNDPWLIGQLYSLLVALTPLVSLGLSLWFLRGPAWNTLRIWPVLGILIAALPGEICLMSEASLAVQAFWPILVLIAVGLPLSGLPWIALLSFYLYFLHPSAALMFFLAAGLSVMLAIFPGKDRRRAFVYGGIFFLLGLARLLFSLATASAYERAELGWEPNWMAFLGSLCGPAFILLACLYAFGLVYFGNATGWISQPVARKRAIGIGALFLIAGVIWAHWPWLWAGAIGYRRFILLCSFPVMLLAGLHWLWLKRGGRPLDSPLSKFSPIVAVALFALVFIVQSLSWRADVLRFQADLRGHHAFVTRDDLPWMRGRAIDHWSSSMLSAIVQGRQPSVLYAESPAHIVGQDIQLFPGGWLYTRDSWFLLSPAHRQSAP